MMYKVIVLLSVVAFVWCASHPVTFAGLNCKKYQAPQNGQLSCTEVAGSKDVVCTLLCNKGFDVRFLGAQQYTCHANGTWSATPSNVGLPWPECIVYGPGDPVP